MNIKLYLKTIVILTCIAVTFTAYAETTPRWVKKGVSELNKMRSNDSYSFRIFHQEDSQSGFDKRYMRSNDVAKFEIDRFQPLLDYVDDTYHVDRTALMVDSIPANGTLPATYMVSFNQDGEVKTVYARLIDQYQKYDDYSDGSFDYDLYQLYAISNPSYATPDFDKFSLSREYGGKPVLMSLIPGLGQIYKGQTAKGYTFLGIEAAMVASIIYSSERVHHWVGLAKKNPEFYDNYQSKATTFRQWRTFCFVAGGGLYIYNLLDAAFSKGARYVEVKRDNNPTMQLSFTPVFLPDMLGVGINIIL